MAGSDQPEWAGPTGAFDGRWGVATVRLVLIGLITVRASLSVTARELPTLFAESRLLIDQVDADCDSICQALRSAPAAELPYDWQLLPDGLLWHSYLAAPHEPRISSLLFHTSDGGSFWDATLGGRVGLLRYGTRGANRPRGLQWDLEGAVITRLDLLHAEDVESMDYRFGTEITAAEGAWAMKFGYFHVSSHVGDEYLVRNPSFERINYVTESWIIGGSYRPIESVRLYGEIANAFSVSGGAQRYQYQTGAEFTPDPGSTCRAMPFAAINLNFREAVDYDVSTTVQLGWCFQSSLSGRRLRFGAQYGDGPTSQYAFFTRREASLGLGVWFDY